MTDRLFSIPLSLKTLFTLLFIVALLLPFYTLAGGQGSALLEAQLTELNGGCPPNDASECTNVQFSIHRAPVCINGPNFDVGNYSISMVREFPSPPAQLAGGSSALVRAGNEYAFNLSTSDLLPDAPHTVWWVIFYPENECIDEGTGSCDCGSEDIDNFFWATGAMTDSMGTATFAGNTEVGEIPEGSEIHLVVRAHGPALKGNGGKGKN